MKIRAFCTLALGLAIGCGGGGDTTDAGDGGNPNDAASEGGCETCVDAPVGGPTTITVLNASGTALVSFPFDASGDVAPSATIAGAQTNLSQASAIAADAQGEIFVSTPLAILVFAPFANGNVAPARTIAGPNALASTDDFAGVAVAPDGTTYAFSELSSGTSRAPKILVFAPNANGNVAPTRTITGPTTTMQAVLASAVHDTTIAEADATQNILFFDTGASGDVAPTRTLKGPTGITEGIAFTPGGGFWLAQYAFSASSADGYSSTGGTTPVVTLSGGSTKVTAAAGVAVASEGTIVVANADPGGASVLVFDPSAIDGAAPTRTIAGASTTLSGDVSQYPMPIVVY